MGVGADETEDVDVVVDSAYNLQFFLRVSVLEMAEGGGLVGQRISILAGPSLHRPHPTIVSIHM